MPFVDYVRNGPCTLERKGFVVPYSRKLWELISFLLTRQLSPAFKGVATQPPHSGSAI